MPVDTQHPSYIIMLPRWNRTADVLAGERVVKSKGNEYLPMLTKQEPAEYESYKERAVFMEITTRTRESFVGFIYRKDPDVKYPTIIQGVMDDATLTGLPFYDYIKDRVRDTVGLGRGGTVIDYHKDAGRPYLRAYAAQDVRNWKVEKVGGKYMLTLLVLYEESNEYWPGDGSSVPDDYEHPSYPQWREFRIMQDTPDGVPYVVCRVWRRKREVAKKGGTDMGGGTGDVAENQSTTMDDFVLRADSIPDRRGTPLSEIPFVFHNANNYLPDVDIIPMEGIANLNVSHYCTSADLEHGRHITGLPTLYAVGFDNADEIALGSTTALTADEPTGNEKVGFVEVASEFKALSTAMDEKQGQMAALGARLLDFQKKDVEAYETARMRQTGETVTLANIAISGGQSGSRILQWLTWWVTTAATVEDCMKVATMELNTEFVATKLDAATWTAANAARGANLISPEAYFNVLKDGDVFPPDWTFDDEKESLDKAGLAMAPPPTGSPGIRALPGPKPPGGPTGQARAEAAAS